MTERQIMALIYGKSGVGKTTVALTAPEPILLLDQEGSANLLGSSYQEWFPRVQKTSELIQGENYFVHHDNILHALERERREQGHFATVIFDTVTHWQEELLLGFEDEHPDGGWKFWNAVGATGREMCGRLKVINKRPNGRSNVIVTAQLHEQRDEKGQIVEYSPALAGKSRGYFVQAADLVGFLSVASNGNRYMQCDLRPTITAKHRSQYLSDNPSPTPVPSDGLFLTDVIKGWREEGEEG